MWGPAVGLRLSAERIGVIRADHVESDRVRFRRESGNAEYARQLRRNTDQDGASRESIVPLTNSRPCERPISSNDSPETAGNGTFFRSPARLVTRSVADSPSLMCEGCMVS